MDRKKFERSLEALSPAEPLTEADTSAAFHNFTGFISLLIKIDKRLSTAMPEADHTPLEPLNKKKNSHADQ